MKKSSEIIMGSRMPMKRERNAPKDPMQAHSLEHLAGYHLRRASVVDLQGATAALEGAGLRPVSLSVLCNIVEKPGVTAADICRVLGMQRANIVSVLADLEEKSLLLRETDESDQRIQRLYPTNLGGEMTARCLALLAEHEDRLLGRLDAGERSELRRLLSLVWQRPSPRNSR
ncbi:MarR family winged helix-turn-helix transcriptional regulator [Rhizobium sp. NPDC090279]|uniref:MarR family winged helix-turn-helix transcriptional regulator n=1 Tax=Rhizobium sp. NPDC090279 TaxID=3364499 RepID=UPI00383BEDF4